MAIEHEIIFAKVIHKRVTPAINQFLYKVFYICFDVAKINKLKSRFFSINRFNIFSFYLKDYGARNGSNIEKWAREILATNHINNVAQIFLLTHPRILGYVFNPVSFYFAIDNQENLQAVIAEVNNTFGETHTYLVYNKNGAKILENQWFIADKEFHVSPFYRVEGEYKFRFIFNHKNIAVWIDYFNNNKTLSTSLISYKKITLNDLNLLKTFTLLPFMVLKVITLIHWQALKIIFKKIKYISKPQQKNIKITINKN